MSTPHLQPPNPLQTWKLEDVLRPWVQAIQGATTELKPVLSELQKVLQNIEFHLHEEATRQKQPSRYDTIYSNGIPYTVRYLNRRYMDVLARRTDDETKNVTIQIMIPGLGLTSGAQLLQLISMNNMLLAGVSPWIPLNLPEGAQITVPADPVANQQQAVYVRYGMEQWGAQ